MIQNMVGALVFGLAAAAYLVYLIVATLFEIAREDFRRWRDRVNEDAVDDRRRVSIAFGIAREDFRRWLYRVNEDAVDDRRRVSIAFGHESTAEPWVTTYVASRNGP